MTIVGLFHDLCDTLDIINSTFTFPLAFMILHFFFSGMITLFNHISSFEKDFNNLSFVIVTEGSWMLMNYVLLAMIIYSSSSTSHEARKTAVIISKIVNNTENNKRHEEVYTKFLLQNQYRNLNLQTPFFNINWQLLLTVCI